MRTSSLLLLLCLVSYAVICASALKQAHIVKRAARSVLDSSNGLPLANSHNNDVIATNLGHYFIYYGQAFQTGGADAAIPAAVQQYFTDISGTPYMNILSQYFGPSGNSTIDISWVGQFIAGTPYGTAIGTADSLCTLKVLERILFNPANGITFNPAVQYYIVFGSDITLTNVAPCQDGGCGLHDQLKKTVNGVNETYLVAWVINNAEGCQPAAISGIPTVAPANIQNVLDTLAHEVAESITDPNQVPQTKRAWQDGEGFEIGDKCADFYTPFYASANVAGAYYNVKGNGGTEYLLQGQWSNEIGGCATARAISGVSNSAGPVGSPSGSKPPVPSGEASGAATPSAFGPLPTNVCIPCNKNCRRYKKFKAICQRKLGGTFARPSLQLCCNGIVEFNSFSWSQSTGSCDYSGPARKLDLLCTALGGREVCQTGILGAVRKTCTH